MAITKWLIKSEQVVFDKFGRQIVKRNFVLPDGQKADYFIKKEENTAGVLALTKNNKVILAKQYRPGPDKILLELPGGFIDGHRNPQEVAEKELLEETGYQGNAQFVVTTVDDAYSTVERNLFVVTECEKVTEPKLESTEFIEIELMDVQEFRQLLRSGQMTDIEAGYLALDFLNLL